MGLRHRCFPYIFSRSPFNLPRYPPGYKCTLGRGTLRLSTIMDVAVSGEKKKGTADGQCCGSTAWQHWAAGNKEEPEAAAK